MVGHLMMSCLIGGPGRPNSLTLPPSEPSFFFFVIQPKTHIMKRLSMLICSLLFFLLLTVNRTRGQDHQLVKVWQTDAALKVPESVLYDAVGKVLYVSNIDGAPDGKDSKGSVGKVGLDGKIIKTDWVSGLNAPKGLGKFNNKIYAADIDEVVVIDIPSAKIEKHIH